MLWNAQKSASLPTAESLIRELLDVDSKVLDLSETKTLVKPGMYLFDRTKQGPIMYKVHTSDDYRISRGPSTEENAIISFIPNTPEYYCHKHQDGHAHVLGEAAPNLFHAKTNWWQDFHFHML